MSGAAPPPWVRLSNSSDAELFQGASIEARRDGGTEIETHEAGLVFRSMGVLWLQIGQEPIGTWSNGLIVDGLWEVRRVGHVLHRDSIGMVGSLAR